MRLEIDIHGLSELDAMKTLEKMIAKAPKDCEEILVIHGYNQGSALKDMVRNPNKLRSNRIKRRKLSMNQGQTLLELYV